MAEQPRPDWPPTWPREEGWTCPSHVVECPSKAWHDSHFHFRRFADLSPATTETANWERWASLTSRAETEDG